MTIPDEAVQAMPEAISDLLKKAYLQGFAASAEGYNSEYPFNEDEAEIQSDKDWMGRRDEFLSNLALPFLQGVKVKALEWKDHDGGSPCVTDRRYDISIWMEGGKPLYVDVYTTMRRHDTLEAAKAAAQADYEARIRSAIEPAPSPRVSTSYEARICKGIPTDCCDYGVVDLSAGIEVCRVWKEDDARWIAELLNGEPSPRAQALEEGADLWRVIEDAAARGYWGIRSQDAGNDDDLIMYPIKIHRDTVAGIVEAHNAAIRALSSQPVANGWLPIETAPKDGTQIQCFFGPKGIWQVSWEELYDGYPIWCVDDGKHGPYPLRGYNDPFPTHWRPLPSSPGASE